VSVSRQRRRSCCALSQQVFVDCLYFSQATGSMKAAFMSLWDGMAVAGAGGAGGRGGVCVLGATNRPWDLDPAILRRFSRQFLFDLPDAVERGKIMRVLLANQRLASDVDLVAVSRSTVKYSGSDLKEMCKFAALRPVRELIRTHAAAKARAAKANAAGGSGGGEEYTDVGVQGSVRVLSQADLIAAMENVGASGAAAYAYENKAGTAQQAQRRANGGGGGGSGAGAGESGGLPANLNQMLKTLFQQQQQPAPSSSASTSAPSSQRLEQLLSRVLTRLESGGDTGAVANDGELLQMMRSLLAQLQSPATSTP
jgi:hypothetical protein